MALNSLSGTITEGNYTGAMLSLPEHVEQRGSGRTAKTVFPELYSSAESRYIYPNPDWCKPGLALRPSQQGKMAASVEWTSFDEGRGIEELLQTYSGSCQTSYFSEVGSLPSGQSWKFYENPPCGLGTLFAGPTAVAVFAYEMVGYLLFSVYDSGSSLGTLQAGEMFRVAKDKTEDTFVVDLAESQASFVLCDTVGIKARWSAQNVGGKFYKLLRYDRCGSGDEWRRLFYVYKTYGAMPELPKVLVQSRLLYGEYQVAVEMDFCSGTPGNGQSVLDDNDVSDLQEALKMLATKNLCYTDFRPENVLRVDGDGVRLIDYDDTQILPEDQSCAEFYYEMLDSDSKVRAVESAFADGMRRVLDFFKPRD